MFNCKRRFSGWHAYNTSTFKNICNSIYYQNISSRTTKKKWKRIWRKSAQNIQEFCPRKSFVSSENLSNFSWQTHFQKNSCFVVNPLTSKVILKSDENLQRIGSITKIEVSLNFIKFLLWVNEINDFTLTDHISNFSFPVWNHFNGTL